MEILLGTNEHGNTVRIQVHDRRKHVFLAGKSGTGKTTLMANAVISDIRAGRGVTVVDPHGQMVDGILNFIPRSRTNDVIYINPAHPERVIGLNLLESVDRNHRPLVVSSLISILKNAWPENWGPRSEWILEHCVYALLEQEEPVTLLAIPKLLTDENYRKQIIKKVTDPAIQSFFNFYESQNDRLRDESITPLLNKVSKFSTNPLLRSIIGQTTSSFDFRWAMDGKVVLCNLSRGALGQDVSSLLGSLIVTKLALASLSRENIPESERVPHFLFCDEIQTFGYGVDFPTILAESRKFSLSLTLATQTLKSLPDKTVAAIFGNCSTIVSFRVSGEDAGTLAREFGMMGDGRKHQMEDNLTLQLQNLQDYTFYLRTISDGDPHEPFLTTSFPPFDLYRNSRRELVVRTSLERFARDRKVVEDKLTRFLTSSA